MRREAEYFRLAKIHALRCNREGLGSPSSLVSAYERLQQHRDFLTLPIRTRNRFNQAASWLLKSFGTTPLQEINEASILQLRYRARRTSGTEFSNVVLALMKTLMAVNKAQADRKKSSRKYSQAVRRP